MYQDETVISIEESIRVRHSNDRSEQEEYYYYDGLASQDDTTIIKVHLQNIINTYSLEALNCALVDLKIKRKSKAKTKKVA